MGHRRPAVKHLGHHEVEHPLVQHHLALWGQCCPPHLVNEVPLTRNLQPPHGSQLGIEHLRGARVEGWPAGVLIGDLVEVQLLSALQLGSCLGNIVMGMLMNSEHTCCIEQVCTHTIA